MKLFILLFFSTFILIGQNVKGVVLDEQTKHPLEHVHVFINHSKTGAVSNKNGEFILKIEVNRNDTISFSAIGYASKKILFSELKNSDNIVYLQKKIENLKEVIVASNKELNSKIRFKKLSSLKLGIHSFASVLIGSKIYVIGGDASNIVDAPRKVLNDLRHKTDASINDIVNGLIENPSLDNYKGDLKVYDVAQDTWLKSDLKFRKRAYNALNYYNNTIYVLGGKRLSRSRKYEYLDDKIEVFDLKNNTITIDDTNPHQAANFGSFTYNNNIIVMGGSIKLNKDGSKVYTNKSHIYNLETGYWYELKDMLKAKETKGVLVENKIYLIGGFNDKPLSEIESYNITSGEWKKEGELFYGMEKPALAYNDRIIYIFEDGKMLTYNIDTKVLNEYDINLNLKASEFYYYNKKIYLLGGYFEDEFSKSPTSRLYSIDLNEFAKTKVKNTKKVDEKLLH
ncbi:carboxypeptidase-like regulatory domain-containing protein [Hwangdonia sp.]|uniref:Kelch repeat-containing protein n=1 Tax=Hwangdonia sp. TaxID=1883432 RepID=UPI003AB2E86B